VIVIEIATDAADNLYMATILYGRTC
jgi:hypothetical protein